MNDLNEVKTDKLLQQVSERCHPAEAPVARTPIQLMGHPLTKIAVSMMVAGVSSLTASPGYNAEPSRSAQDLQPPSIPSELSIYTGVQLEPIGVRSQHATPMTDTPETTVAQATDTPPAKEEPKSQTPDLLDTSPVFQRWNKKIPNVLDDIRRDPAFRTRLRLGLSYFPSTFDSLGWNVGIEDVFIGKTGLTVSADYQATFTGDRKAGGGELRYYILPMGSYFNIAPVLGYRYLETPRYVTDGLNVGAKFQAILSRTGGADISFTQTWVNPSQSEEVGLTKFSFGYALMKNVRLSTDIEKQNSKQKKDTRFGISFEWMF